MIELFPELDTDAASRLRVRSAVLTWEEEAKALGIPASQIRMMAGAFAVPH